MSDPLVIVGILWAVLAVAFVLVWVIRRHHGPIDTGPATSFVGSVMGLLLSLVLFFALGHRGTAQSAAQAEATAYTTLFSSMAPLPGEISDPPQHAAVCVMRSIIDDEWPAMQGRDLSGATSTRAAIGQLYAAIEAMPRTSPAVEPWFPTVWNSMIDRAGARDTRLGQGEPQLPLAIWVTLYVGVFIVVMLVGVSERVRGRAAWIGVGASLAIIVTLLVGASAVLDQPYGPVAPIEPDAMRNSLSVVEANQPENSPIIAPC
ncbi:MAG: hypothetical protein FJW92_03850 [Actinobacteria bacterium]|nr:hypothetical protein [Actinomycetota bacterium]